MASLVISIVAAAAARQKTMKMFANSESNTIEFSFV
jgi:hypothetical protein